MQNKTKLFKTAICIITTLILIFGTIPCGAVLSDESNAPTFTNLVVFMKADIQNVMNPISKQ